MSRPSHPSYNTPFLRGSDALLDRIASRWWHNLPDIERIHHDGENVSVDLLVRLDGLMKDRRGQFIAIALATNGRIGGNDRLPNLVKRAREKGVVGLNTQLGLRYLVTKNMSLFGEWKYNRASFNFSPSSPTQATGGVKGDYSANILAFGVGYHF